MVRYAVATGLWSAASTWDGLTTIPGAGDDVYANGFIVSIDQNIVCTKISTEVCPTTLVGAGSFRASKNSDNYFVCDVIAGLSGCLDYGQYMTNTNVRLYLTGNVVGGSATAAWGINLSSTANFNAPIQQPNIVGNLTGGIGSAAVAITSRGDRSYTVLLTGNATAGTGADCIAITGSALYTNIWVGNATAVGAFRAFISNGILYFTGTATPSTQTWAIQTNQPIYVSGTFVNINGVFPIAMTTGPYRVYVQNGGSLSWVFEQADMTPITLYSSNVPGFPSVINVRTGIQYGPINEFTGTCAVPAASEVVKGVPIDNTVGTYALSGDLITRLEQCSTVPITGAQIASYNV